MVYRKTDKEHKTYHSSQSKLVKETPQATCAEMSECAFLLGAEEVHTGVVGKRSDELP